MAKARSKADRIAKVNALIQTEVGRIIHAYTADGPGIVTVSSVETSRDLRWTKVWLSILGGDDEKILSMLHHELYHIQGQLNDVLKMKITPRIQFFLDTSPRYAQHINEVIQTIDERGEKD
jgi:ribosome-binding factor A